MNQTQLEAYELVQQGKGEMLVHFIAGDPDQGLSSPITIEDYQKGGYISAYYFIKQIASPVSWNGDEFLL